MESNNITLQVQQLCEMIHLLSSSMDDYLYVYDFQNDFYYISPSAVSRFRLPNNSFYDVMHVHEQFVYPEDYSLLKREIHELRTGNRYTHNMMYRWLSRDRTPVWINYRSNIIRENGQAVYMTGCISEINSQRKTENSKIIPGTSGFHSYLRNITPFLSRGAFLRFGIDGLKSINAHHGIEYGNLILQKTTEYISANLLPGQQLYHILGDEYMVTDHQSESAQTSIQLYRQVSHNIEEFIIANNYEAMFTISCGIILCKDIDDFSYSDVMKLTEFSLNEAKRRGKNQYYLFEKEDYEKFLRKNALTQQLRQSISNHFEGFEAYFQPLVHSNTQKIYGAETLMRFYSDSFGTVSPTEFIPILEETGLIIPAGRWILNQAAAACKKFQQYIPDFKISVNLSHVQVLKSRIGNDVINAVKEYDITPESIIIELTESGLLETDSHLNQMWSQLKKEGISLALDDFGTGYSNFAYLASLHPDTIKIDRGFTFRALHNEYEYQLLSLFSSMAHELKLSVCIEGVETSEELLSVCELSPDYIQGYFFGQPCGFDTFMDTYIKNHSAGGA